MIFYDVVNRDYPKDFIIATANFNRSSYTLGRLMINLHTRSTISMDVVTVSSS